MRMPLFRSYHHALNIIFTLPIGTTSFVTRNTGFHRVSSLVLPTFPKTNTIYHTQFKMSSSSSQDEHIIASNIQHVREQISQTLVERKGSHTPVRLVAVSKTKPVEMLLEAYHIAGQRYFGENYVQELISKVPLMPKDVMWHFIGPLQSNKAALLVKSVGLEQLACVESVDSIKLATKLNRAVEGLVTPGDNKTLKIFIQVNTSQEGTKSGVESAQDAVNLAIEIQKTCPLLQITGLMTIGAPGDLDCFDSLAACRRQVAQALGIQDETQLELSMGMSNDFREAILRGSTNVRVGSTIFGERIYPTKKAEEV